MCAFVCTYIVLSTYVETIINNIFQQKMLHGWLATSTKKSLKNLIFLIFFYDKFYSPRYSSVPIVLTSTIKIFWLDMIWKYSKIKYWTSQTIPWCKKCSLFCQKWFLEKKKTHFLKNWLLHINNATKLSQNFLPNF